MALPAFLTALLLPAQEPTPFSVPQAVAQPSRLAITPYVDGTIRADEWDLFAQSNEGETFMQWEPGKLYIAVRMKADRELIVSLDNKQNGWLVDKDNLEFRLRHIDGKPQIQVRQLDATNVAGPRWSSLPAYERAAYIKSSEENGEVQVEAILMDPGLGLLPVKEQERYSLRMDIVAQASQSLEPFIPRIGTLVTLKTERASAMPIGLDWKVEEPGRSVVPGGSTKLRFSFSAKDDPGLKRVEIKPLGRLAEHSTELGQPFPAFDRKGRAFVDYEARTGKDAPTGYHLLTTTLISADGIPAMIQASMRVAPMVDFELVDEKLELRPGVQEVKLPFYIKSNSVNRVDGTTLPILPEGWQITRDFEKEFVIYHSRAGVRRVLTVAIPADAKGPYPIRFEAQMGSRKVESTRWISIIRKVN